MSKSRVNLLSRSRIRKRISADRAANGGEWARDEFCIELGMLEAHLAGRHRFCGQRHFVIKSTFETPIKSR
jgi:hypothetical protein